MDTQIRAFDLFWNFYNTNNEFHELVDEGFKNGKIRFFGNDEWNKIINQNFMSYVNEMKNFGDMFLLGYNIGNCVNTSYQLSYSYDDVDIVSGILPILKGTMNAEKEGGHCWLENDKEIIDTSLMLIIDKSLKSEFGYIEEIRVTKEELLRRDRYQARKEFTNDKSFKK